MPSKSFPPTTRLSSPTPQTVRTSSSAARSNRGRKETRIRWSFVAICVVSLGATVDLIFMATSSQQFMYRNEAKEPPLNPGRRRIDAADSSNPNTNDERAPTARKVNIQVQASSATTPAARKIAKAVANTKIAGAKNKTFAVSYSLYGSDRRYINGMINVAQRTLDAFSDWQVWIYHDNTVPKRALRKLSQLTNVRLINVQDDDIIPSWVHAKLNPMTWRFLIASNATVDAFAIRDADSLPSAREYAAVREWLASGKAFHFVRDHPMHDPTHFAPILGGMWGAWHYAVPQMQELLHQRYVQNSGNSSKRRQTQYAEDQDFLWTEIMPIAYRDVLQHDSYYCRESNAIAFPVAREDSHADGKSSFFFVGNTFARNNKVVKDVRMKKPEAWQRYRHCLADRLALEQQFQRQGLDFATHVNTTFAGKIQGSSTQAWREWSQKLHREEKVNKKKKQQRL